MNITLDTLKDATAQQVFDQVASHLLTQNAKAKTGERCEYRTKEGLSCAVGCLMTDEHIARAPNAAEWKEEAYIFGVESYHEELLSLLQGIHDSDEVDYWELALRRLSKDRNLEVNF